MVEKTKNVSPPYATYGSFINFINKLRETGVPSRIDPSVFGGASGSVSYSVIAALKYLGLIEEDGKPTQLFSTLVNASDEERSKILDSVIRAGYPSLFSETMNLKRATAGEFDDLIRKEFDVQGSTVDKIAAFFISAAKQAQIELSPHLVARKPIANSSSSKKSVKQRKRDDVGGAQDFDNDRLPPPQFQISEKALEYRLVDLMADAAGEPEVMQAIIKVLTYLKTRDVSQ